MQKCARLLISSLMAVVVLGLTAVDPKYRAHADADGVIPFSVVQLFIERNATDNDAGIQVFFDGEAWKEAEIFDPKGRKILGIETQGDFKKLGLTDLRFESAEPSLDEVKAKFPPGVYKFKGKTLKGGKLVGTAELSHAIPDAPTNVAVNFSTRLITWTPSSETVRQQVIVASADDLTLTVDLPNTASDLQIPSSFPVTPPIKVEVLAIAANGNRTIAEGTFSP